MKKIIFLLSLLIILTFISGCEENIIGKKLIDIDKGDMQEPAEPPKGEIVKETVQKSEDVTEIEPTLEQAKKPELSKTDKYSKTYTELNRCEKSGGICSNNCEQGYVENPDLSSSCSEDDEDLNIKCCVKSLCDNDQECQQKHIYMLAEGDEIRFGENKFILKLICVSEERCEYGEDELINGPAVLVDIKGKDKERRYVFLPDEKIRYINFYPLGLTIKLTNLDEQNRLATFVIVEDNLFFKEIGEINVLIYEKQAIDVFNLTFEVISLGYSHTYKLNFANINIYADGAFLEGFTVYDGETQSITYHIEGTKFKLKITANKINIDEENPKNNFADLRISLAEEMRGDYPYNEKLSKGQSVEVLDKTLTLNDVVITEVIDGDIFGHILLSEILTQSTQQEQERVYLHKINFVDRPQDYYPPWSETKYSEDPGVKIKISDIKYTKSKIRPDEPYEEIKIEKIELNIKLLDFYCKNNNVIDFREKIRFECENPGSIDSECSASIVREQNINDACNENEYCVNDYKECLPNNPSTVMIRDDNTLMLNEKPFFPIGIYYASPGRYKELSENGFNSVLSTFGPFLPTQKTDCTQITNALQEASKHNLFLLDGAFIGPIDASQGYVPVHFTEDIIREYLINTVLSCSLNHPNFLGWTSIDEVSLCHWPGQPPEFCDKLIDTTHNIYNKIKEKDPYHIVYLNHAGTTDLQVPINKTKYVEDIREFNTAADIVSVDVYPVGYPSGTGPCSSIEYPNANDINCLGLFVDLLKESVNDEKPVLFVLQSLKRGGGEELTLTEARFIAYEVIVHGVKGIYYYGHPQASYDKNTKRVAKELSSLHDVLTSRTIEKDVVKEAISLEEPREINKTIKTLLKQQNNNLFLISVNEENYDVSVTFEGFNGYDYATVLFEESEEVPVTGSVIRKITGGAVRKEFKYKRIKIENGEFSDDFEDFGVHVYLITKKEVDPSEQVEKLKEGSKQVVGTKLITKEKQSFIQNIKNFFQNLF